MRAGLIVDNWKKPFYTKALKENNYNFNEDEKAELKGCVMLAVEFTNENKNELIKLLSLTNKKADKWRN